MIFCFSYSWKFHLALLLLRHHLQRIFLSFPIFFTHRNKVKAFASPPCNPSLFPPSLRTLAAAPVERDSNDERKRERKKRACYSCELSAQLERSRRWQGSRGKKRGLTLTFLYCMYVCMYSYSYLLVQGLWTVEDRGEGRKMVKSGQTEKRERESRLLLS